MFFVYVIENIDNNKIYIGQTDDLQKRLDRHNCKLKNKTKSYTSKQKGEWQYIYVEGHSTRKAARAREK